jgi:hypothetical protein
VTYFKALKTHYTNLNPHEIGETVTYPSLDANRFKSMICNRSIEGANKNITMNHICDRIDIGYTVYDMDPDSGELEVHHKDKYNRDRLKRVIILGCCCLSS